MRRVVSLLALPLSLACGDEIDHPAPAAACDPATMDCTSSPPLAGGSDLGGGEGGEGSGDASTTWTGQVLAYTGDDFDQGTTFNGQATVSATGVSGGRVEAAYDGKSFTLEDITKEAANWFLVEPEAGSGLLPTLSPVDTRAVTNDVGVGVVRESDIDGIFTLALASTDRSTERAQVVVHVVDDQGRTVRGVQASLSAEFTAYRGGGTWDATEGAATDDSGLIFLGNVPATSALAVTNIAFRGAVSASVKARIQAGATTVLTAVVSPP